MSSSDGIGRFGVRKKGLLSTTAIAGAGMFLTTAAPALAEIELQIFGQVEMAILGATGDTLIDGERDRSYGIFSDASITFDVTGVTESDIRYGARVELEADIEEDESGGDNADETMLFFAGGFGRLELGRTAGAESNMVVDGTLAQAGTGGIDGDTANLTESSVQDTDDAAKVSYYTPRIAGLQLGGSWTPDTSDTGTKDNEEEFQKDFAVGTNWVGTVGSVDLTVGAVGDFADGQNAAESPEKRDWSVGGLIEISELTIDDLTIEDLTIGLSYGQRTKINQEFATLGLEYGFDVANVSVGYNYFKADEEVNNNVIALSADIGLFDGVVAKMDITYNSDDPDKNDDGDNNGTTWSGVASIQVNF